MVATDQQTEPMCGIESANSPTPVPVPVSPGATVLTEPTVLAGHPEKTLKDGRETSDCSSRSASQGPIHTLDPLASNMAHPPTETEHETATDNDPIDASIEDDDEMPDITFNHVQDEQQNAEHEEQDGNMADVSNSDLSSALDVNMSYGYEENSSPSASNNGNLSSEHDVNQSYRHKKGDPGLPPVYQLGKASHGSTRKQSKEKSRQKRREIRAEETKGSSDESFQPESDTKNHNPRHKRREVQAEEREEASDPSFEPPTSDTTSESAGSSDDTANEVVRGDRVKVEPTEDSQHELTTSAHDRSHSQGSRPLGKRRLVVKLSAFVLNGIAKKKARSVQRALSSVHHTERKRVADLDDDTPLLKCSRQKESGTAGHQSGDSRVSGRSRSTNLSLSPEATTNTAMFGGGSHESDDEEGEDEEEGDAEEGDAEEDGAPTMSWKLPEYEILRTNDPSEDVPSAKVSLPGLVREPIMLGLEYPDLMFRLIKEVFLPSHARTWEAGIRDPEPQFSLLNFCVIADIFIAVFNNFQQGELGDVIGGVLPRDVDPDQVFFAAIDNWRVGREMKRKRYDSIRGIQEFCDVGLEVLWWIKENWDEGEEKVKRKARSDKGVKRGPRASKDGGAKPANTLVAKPKAKGKGKGAGTEKTKGKKAPEKAEKKAGLNKVKTGRVTKKQKN